MFFGQDMQLLTSHKLCPGRGVTIRNSDHTRDKSQSIEVLKASVLELMKDTPKAKLFIELLEKQKSRYLRDNLLLLKKRLTALEPEFILKAIDFCLENNIYNANDLVETGIHYQKQQVQDESLKLPWGDHRLKALAAESLYEPKSSKISTYEKVM